MQNWRGGWVSAGSTLFPGDSFYAGVTRLLGSSAPPGADAPLLATQQKFTYEFPE